jgi:hypothetical protein
MPILWQMKDGAGMMVAALRKTLPGTDARDYLRFGFHGLKAMGFTAVPRGTAPLVRCRRQATAPTQ